jgi:plasmid maintenance system killer protein
MRLRMIRGASSLAELYGLRMLDLHPLTGNRSGQLAARITGQTRLVLTVLSDTQVRVEEVVDYHG